MKIIDKHGNSNILYYPKVLNLVFCYTILMETDFEITYKRNTTEHTVVFDVNAENPLLNRFKSRNVELLKTDGEGNALAGVVFALYRKYMDEYVQIGSYTTGRDGRILIENIPYGEYYFIETQGLEGYEFDGETRYFFTVDDDQPEEYTIRLEAVNKRIPETPKTGDSNPTTLVIILMLLAVIATSVLSGHGIYKLYEKAVSEEEKLELQKALRIVAGSTVLAAAAAFVTLVTGNGNMLTMVCGMVTMSIAAGVNVAFSTWAYRKEANKTCTVCRETGGNRNRRFVERSTRKRI